MPSGNGGRERKLTDAYTFQQDLGSGRGSGLDWGGWPGAGSGGGRGADAGGDDQAASGEGVVQGAVGYYATAQLGGREVWRRILCAFHAGGYERVLAEVPVKIEGHDLPAGIYGVGFIPGGKFIVLDVGSHDLFTVDSHTEADLKRPVPLKVTAAKDGFRLYEGRSYVTFAR